MAQHRGVRPEGDDAEVVARQLRGEGAAWGAGIGAKLVKLLEEGAGTDRPASSRPGDEV